LCVVRPQHRFQKEIWMPKTTLVEILILVIALLGLIFFLLGLRRLWRGGWISGSLEGLTGLLFITASLLAGAILVNLLTYDRLTRETLVSEIRFQAISSQRFLTYLTPMKGNARILEMRGDEWQIDARVLKWRGVALLLGFDPVYRLERLGGRYHDINQERSSPRTVYSLSEDPGLDLWKFVRKNAHRIPWVDAVYGSATYMPMVDGAHYAVYISPTGLLARPQNDIAKKALSQWR
jgi:hypothetical protein